MDDALAREKETLDYIRASFVLILVVMDDALAL